MKLPMTMRNGVMLRTLWCGVIFSVVATPKIFAQTAAHDGTNSGASSASTNASASTNGGGATNATQQILAELEQMRERIQQLEAQLKAQNAAAPTAATAGTNGSTGPAATGNPNAASTVVALPTTSPSSVANATNVANFAPMLPPSRLGQTSPDQASAANTKQEKPAPFSFGDFTWLNGNSRIEKPPIDTEFFTPEIRADVDYIYDFNHPADDSIGGSSEVFRSNEVQVTQLGVGGDFHYDNVRGRLMTQFGMYSETTPRNDASVARGQWDLDTAYRYISEAYGGYHINALNGINIDAGIFMSYIGLFSYYNFDNWAYQPSYVSSNTPWFFNGLRVQIFPTQHLKIEPWFVNGWQSYGRFNNRPGIGLQVLYRPNSWLSVLGNQYMLGEDDLGAPGRVRYHTDDSLEIKYYDDPEGMFSKAAFSLTGDMGCEHGDGVSCDTDSVKTIGGQKTVWPKQDFLGFMFYNRFWFHKNLFGLTFGGGKINNPGRYLVLLPPINGATAASGTPYFTENPGDPFKAWDASGTFDYMPSQYITFRWEFDHRAASVPYFTGSGGITPPGGNTGLPGSFVTLPGSTCNGLANTWCPDLVKIENRIDLAILVMF